MQTASLALRSSALDALYGLQQGYGSHNPVVMLQAVVAQATRDGGVYVDYFNGYDYDEDGCRYESSVMVWLDMNRRELVDAVGVVDAIECESESVAVRMVCDGGKVKGWNLTDWYTV